MIEMKTRYKVCLVISALLMIVLIMRWSRSESNTAEKSAEFLLNALCERNGELASSALTDGEFTYFEVLKKRALKLYFDEIRPMQMHDKLLILILRRTTEANKLEKWSGRRVFLHMIDNGLLFEPYFKSCKIISSVDSKDQMNAAVQLEIEDHSEPESWYVLKKDGIWRVSFSAALQVACRIESTRMEQEVRRLAKEKEISGQEARELVLFERVRVATGRIADPQLWDPMVDALIR